VPVDHFISELTDAADRCDDSATAALLRRAALKLANLECPRLDADVEPWIELYASQYRTTRNEMIRRWTREYAESLGLVRVHELDEDGPASGNG
jgi:hypothetical protein